MNPQEWSIFARMAIALFLLFWYFAFVLECLFATVGAIGVAVFGVWLLFTSIIMIYLVTK